MAKWNPSKVIEREARKLQAAAIRAVRSAAQVPHRGTQDPTRKSYRAATLPGGSLAAAIGKRDFLSVKRWGVVLRWASLGQKFLWFVQGTKRQKPRPVTLAPPVPALVRDLEADAAAHFTRAQARAR